MLDEGRARRGPDLGVSRARLARPEGQDEKVEQRPTAEGVDVDDARIGQELAQVAPHLAGRRGIGRAEIEDQNGRFQSSSP
jgi:hypothetical protein